MLSGATVRAALRAGIQSGVSHPIFESEDNDSPWTALATPEDGRGKKKEGKRKKEGE
jgi:hypothetical protein